MPQTVPNRPMKGAVEPTEASTARPDCSRAVDSSMELRSVRVSHSLTSSESCSCCWAWWCAVASRPSSASARNGLDGSVPSLLRPSAKSAACQKLSVDRACAANLAQVQRLDDDHHPGGKRHRQQQHGYGLGDEVALGPEVDQAELRVHVVVLGGLFKNEIDGRLVPHGLRHAAALARHVAPLHDVFERGAVQAVEAAGAFELGLLGRAVRRR